MKKIIAGAALALLLTACGQDKAATETTSGMAATPKHSGLLVEGMDTDVRPGDDFNLFANGGWVKTTEIPADKASYGIGYILHEESQEQVQTIIEEAAAGDFAKGSDEQKVGDLYASYMDIETRNKLGATPLDPEISAVLPGNTFTDGAVAGVDVDRVVI